MKGNGPTLGKEWVNFVKTSIVPYGGRAGVVATAVVVVVWLVVLGIAPVSRLSVVVLELFVALALASTLVAIHYRNRWPAQALFVWAIRERARLYESSPKTSPDEKLASRVNDMIFGGSGEPGTWDKVRVEARNLRPSARREHVLATADLFETDEYDSAAFDAALAELGDDAERRYWRVRLAMTEAFAAYAADEDYMPILLQASSREGPFDLAVTGKLRLLMYRYTASASFLCVGIVAALAIAIAWGA